MSPTQKAEPESGWRNRITGHGEEAPDQLLANPRNWRVHPKAQQDALAAVLDQVGWVQDVIVNQRTGHVVDGHARIALAISKGGTACNGWRFWSIAGASPAAKPEKETSTKAARPKCDACGKSFMAEKQLEHRRANTTRLCRPA